MTLLSLRRINHFAESPLWFHIYYNANQKSFQRGLMERKSGKSSNTKKNKTTNMTYAADRISVLPIASFHPAHNSR
jgi:hypothetical protein